MGNSALTQLRILSLSLPYPTPSNPTLHIHPGLAFSMSMGFSIPSVANAELLGIHQCPRGLKGLKNSIQEGAVEREFSLLCTEKPFHRRIELNALQGLFKIQDSSQQGCCKFSFLLFHPQISMQDGEACIISQDHFKLKMH